MVLLSSVGPSEMPWDYVDNGTAARLMSAAHKIRGKALCMFSCPSEAIDQAIRSCVTADPPVGNHPVAKRIIAGSGSEATTYHGS